MKQEREQHHENLGWGMTMNWCNEAEKKKKVKLVKSLHLQNAKNKTFS